MRIAVTGATGNVGTSVVEALGSDDRVDEIVAIARRPASDGDFGGPKTRFVAADVARDDLRAAFAGADAVIHLAWLFQPTHAPLVTWRANAVGSTRVFEAAAAAGVNALVHASSVGAYSPAVDDHLVDEHWPTDSMPTAAYGREKAYVERVLDGFEAAHPEIRTVRLRPAFIFKRVSASEQRRLFAGPFVPGWIAGRRVPVVPLPRGLRFQALHASDVADAYRRAVLSDVRGAFNLASEPVIDTTAIAGLVGGRPLLVPPEVIRSAMWAAWQLHVVPSPPALFDLAMRLPLMSAERARDELGWSPRVNGVDAMREMLDGLAEGAGGATPPLAPDSPQGRLEELATSVGRRERV